MHDAGLDRGLGKSRVDGVREAFEAVHDGDQMSSTPRFREERAALRQTEAKPIFDNLEEWLHAQLPKISGRSPLAKAIRYALGRMPKARPYLEDGFLELHSNIGDAGQNCRSLRSHQRPVYEPPKLEDASQATLQNLLQ